jgi:hypothetical protein
VALADVASELEGLPGLGLGGLPVAEAERGVGDDQPSRAQDSQGARILRAAAQFGVLVPGPLELSERDERPDQNVQPWPVRAERVYFVREAEGLG